MNVSFGSGTIYMLKNQYSIRKNGKDNDEPANYDDLILNTDNVQYVTSEYGLPSSPTKFHLLNGDVITLKHRNGVDLYNLARQLSPKHEVGFSDDSSFKYREYDPHQLGETLEATKRVNNDSYWQRQ